MYINYNKVICLRREDTLSLSNLRKAFVQGVAYEWGLKEWQKLRTCREVILGTGNNEQKARVKLWDACPAWVECKCLWGNNEK